MTYLLRSDGALCDPLVNVHDCFDQESQSFEFGEVQVFDGLIKAAINPLIVSSLIDREVLIKRVTLNAIGDSILMNKIGGVEL